MADGGRAAWSVVHAERGDDGRPTGKTALALDQISYFNVVWASAEGSIGYLQAGEVPVERNDPREVWSDAPANVEVSNLYFDAAPIDLVDEIVTEALEEERAAP